MRSLIAHVAHQNSKTAENFNQNQFHATYVVPAPRC